MMKKSYTLLLTILLVTLFSYLALNIAQTKSFSNSNIQNQYLYIQAKNHLLFMKDYLNSLNINELESINKLKIDDENFNIESFIKKVDNSYEIEIFIQSKEFDIRLYEKIIR